jgi:hypothetical protein
MCERRSTDKAWQIPTVANPHRGPPLDLVADQIRRDAAERSGRTISPAWEELPEAERERWRRAAEVKPERPSKRPQSGDE